MASSPKSSSALALECTTPTTRVPRDAPPLSSEHTHTRTHARAHARTATKRTTCLSSKTLVAAVGPPASRPEAEAPTESGARTLTNQVLEALSPGA